MPILLANRKAMPAFRLFSDQKAMPVLLLLATLCLPAAGLRCYHYDQNHQSLSKEEEIIQYRTYADGNFIRSEQTGALLTDKAPCLNCKYLVIKGGFVMNSQRCHYTHDTCASSEVKDNKTGVTAEVRCCKTDLCNKPDIVAGGGLSCHSDAELGRRTQHLTNPKGLDPTGTAYSRHLVPPLIIKHACRACMYGKKGGKLVGGTRTCWPGALVTGSEKCEESLPVPGGHIDHTTLNAHLDEVVCCEDPNCNAKHSVGSTIGITAVFFTTFPTFLFFSY